jgi:NADH-quinone oxidoreductase subunit I
MSVATKQNPFILYWKNLWGGISTTVAGMRLTLSYFISGALGYIFPKFFANPVTLRYPEERSPVIDGHRGLHCYDLDNCNVCQSCVKACPVNCISIDYEGKGKNAVISGYTIDYTKCVFCNLCCEVCPTNCIWMGPDWDLSAFTREDCVVDLATLNRDAMLKKKWPSLIKAEQEAAAKKAAAAKAAAEKKAVAAEPKDKE